MSFTPEDIPKIQDVKKLLFKKIKSDTAFLTTVENYFNLLDKLKNFVTINITKKLDTEFDLKFIYDSTKSQLDKVSVIINDRLIEANEALKEKKGKPAQIVKINGKLIGEEIRKKQDFIEQEVKKNQTVELDLTFNSSLNKEDIETEITKKEEELEKYDKNGEVDKTRKDDLKNWLETDSDNFKLLVKLLIKYSEEKKTIYSDINKIYFFEYNKGDTPFTYEKCEFSKHIDDKKPNCSKKPESKSKNTESESNKDFIKILTSSIAELTNFEVFLGQFSNKEAPGNSPNNIDVNHVNHITRPRRDKREVNNKISDIGAALKKEVLKQKLRNGTVITNGGKRKPKKFSVKKKKKVKRSKSGRRRSKRSKNKSI